MTKLADLMNELRSSDLAREALDQLEQALARRTTEEQGAFWRAIDLYYFSRKAPPEPVAAEPPVV